MTTFYIYQTQTGILKISEQYCVHVFKIKAKTLAAAKAALTRHNKNKKKDGI